MAVLQTATVRHQDAKRLATVRLILAALKDQPVVSAIAGAVSLVGPAVYIWGRSILKAEQARQTDLIPDAWEERLSQVLDGVERLTRAVQAAKEKT